MKFKFLFSFTFVLFLFQSCTNSKVETKSVNDSISNAIVTKKDIKDSSLFTPLRKDSVLKASKQQSIHNNHSELSNNHTFLLDSYPMSLKKRLGKVGKRKGNGSPGRGGDLGNTGKKQDVQNNHGSKPGETGLYSYSFSNFRLNSSIKNVDADGEGTIACRVSVDCSGNYSIVEYGSRGTTYTGSVSGLQKAVDYFLRNSHFEKVGEACPESGLIYLDIKSPN